MWIVLGVDVGLIDEGLFGESFDEFRDCWFLKSF